MRKKLINELNEKIKELEENYKRLLTCFYSANKRYFEILDKYEDINFKFKQEKQQLHNLPKKIVEEIRKEIELPLYVHPYFDEFECVFDIDRLLDTILKKYEEIKMNKIGNNEE